MSKKTANSNVIRKNDTKVSYPNDTLVHTLFEEQVQKTPNSPIISFADTSLTYAQLNQKANQLARYLKDQGVTLGDPVGIAMPRSLDMVIGLLAIIKCGGCYVALDPNYPSNRLAFMISDSQIKIMVTTSAILATLPLDKESSVNAICLDKDGFQIASMDIQNLEINQASNSPLYVLYTSGSTGVPKGVVGHHRGAINRFNWMWREYPFQEGEVCCQKTTLNFVDSVWEIWGPLLKGVPTVLIPDEAVADPRQLVPFLAENDVSRMVLVPSLLKTMLEVYPDLGDHLPKLNLWTTSGETLSFNLYIQFKQAAPNATLLNIYGSSEIAADATYFDTSRELVTDQILIGKPIDNLQVYILDDARQPVSMGETGELYVSGDGVALGYYNRPDLTAQRFMLDPFVNDGKTRMFKTGDYGRYHPDGNIEFQGRADQQVKIRGIRIELGEIEARLLAHPHVKETVLTVHELPNEDKILAAYVVPQPATTPTIGELRAFIGEKLPDYMIPATLIFLHAFPLTPNGKIDRQSLPALAQKRPLLDNPFVPPRTKVEKQLASLWQETLFITGIGAKDNFFELGGDSLSGVSLIEKIRQAFKVELAAHELYADMTIQALAQRVEGRLAKKQTSLPQNAPLTESENDKGLPSSQDIAIIGMAGRFPKAKNIDALWENLMNGVEGIRFFTPEELTQTEPDLNELITNPDYVPAAGTLADIDQFDARFFNINPSEARYLDPQQRIWLETAWETLENAGYVPSKFSGDIGVFAGSYLNNYKLYNLMPDRNAIEGYVRLQTPDALLKELTNEADYLPTRTAHLLNLTGPAINIQTACSTSLVAVVTACNSIRQGESDMALAGGVTIFLPQERGYIHQEGGIQSADGHCRPFDAKGSGTVFASGVGCVLLKRLDKAIADGDNVLAVIKGTGLNNDGRFKASYTAPSVAGQKGAILKAQQNANVPAESISYIEAHGTATPLGDPIEIAALSEAFRTQTDQKGFCGIGSIKSNIGHLDVAAGIAGLIKTVLAFQHEQLPPTLHYEQSNPEIDFVNSPFYVVDQPTPWPKMDTPRRAGISAFGMGGTNAHVILEESPQVDLPSTSRPYQLLTLSAKSETALATQAAQLAKHLQQKRPYLPDVAYTLINGRADFSHRHVIVADTLDHAATQLLNAKAGFKRHLKTADPSLVWMFPGQGAQFVGMGQELYKTNHIYQQAIDECATLLQPHLNLDIRHILYPANPDNPQAAEQLTQTGLAQPAIFMVSYATAKVWQDWGVHPDALVGHSVGEFVAATLAGVFSLEDALIIIANRASLMQSLPSGSMRAVRLSAADLTPLLTDGVTLAAANAPHVSVVSGPTEAVDRFDEQMSTLGYETIVLHTSHAFHSAMMDPILEPFEAIVAQAERHPPQLPIVSTRTGTWLTDDEAVDPRYWSQQLRQAVRFSDAVVTLQAGPNRVMLEVGPGKTLSSAVMQHARTDAKITAVDSLGHPKKREPALKMMLEALGKLWLNDVKIAWPQFYRLEKRQRVPLPTYPFERARYWVDPPPLTVQNQAALQPTATPNLLSSMTATAVSNTLETHQTNPTISKDQDRAMSRKENIQTALISLLTEISGIELSPDVYQTPFLELGFDSLLLTQLSAELKKEMRVNIRFRKMLEDVTSLDLLVEYCADELPEEAYAASQPAPTPQPATAVAPPTLPEMQLNPSLPPANGNNALILQQMALQQQTLTALLQQQQLIQSQLFQQMGAGSTTVQPTNGQAATVEKVVEVKRNYPNAPQKDATDKVNKVRFGPYKPLQKGSKGQLTEQQRAYLAQFTEKLTSKTAGSKALAQKNRDVQADPRTVAGYRNDWKELVYQIATNRSKGAKLWDIDGNEYVDMTCGFGVNFFGHSPEFVTKAVIEQIEQGVELGPQAPLAGEVARMLRELTGMERVSFCNTGSEAIMAALRMARTITGREKVVYFSGDYHGVFDEALARSQDLRGKLVTLGAAPGITEDSVSNIWVLDYGTQASLDFIVENKDEIAAVLIETVQSRYPENRPFAFVSALRDITKENDMALVFDEVVTGFRVHPSGMQHVYGVKPDIACYGKIVGGGYPIGVVAGDKKFMDTIDGGWWQYGDESEPEVDLTFFAGTFVRHRVALAAAKAVLTYINENPHLQSWMNERTSRFAHTLNGFFEAQGAPIKINHYSSWFRVEVAPDYKFVDLIFYHLIEKGVFVFTSAQNCFLSAAHSDEDIEHIINAFKETVHDLQSGGFLPEPERETAVIPLTPAQQEIWLAEKLHKTAAAAYIESFCIYLDGEINPSKLQRATEMVIRRHPALHTRFLPEMKGQVIRSDRRINVPLINYTGLDNEEAKQAFEAMIEREQTTPFDLENGPLVRAMLVQFEPQRFAFLWFADHIVFDGWSSSIMIDEIRQLYNAEMNSVPIALPKVDHIIDYVTWEKEEVAGERGAEILAYWQQEFETIPPVLDLPSDTPRPSEKSYQGASVHYEFDADLIAKVRQMANEQNSSLFSVMLASYHILLSRLSGQEDVVIGIHTAGQALSGMTHLVGHAVGLLPIRMQAEKSLPFTDFLQSVKTKVLDAQEMQPFTFGQLLESINIPRDLSRSPLVEVVFNLDRKIPPESFVGATQTIREIEKRAINWDLFLNLYEEENTVKVDFIYSTDLFTEARIMSWLDYLGNILRAVAVDPKRPLHALPLLSEQAVQKQLRDWNSTQTAYPADKNVAELVNEQASKHPDQIAIQAKDSELTYLDLNKKVNQFANYLQANGVRAGTVVGLSMQRTTDMVVALLGIMKAGGVYVPIDPTFPQERIVYIINDSQMDVYVVDSESQMTLPESAATLIVFDEISEELANQSENWEGASVSGDSPVYMIYTSGSTGNPKGVLIPHRALVNFLCSMQKAPGMLQDDVLLSVTTLSFDIAGLELYLPLITGARLLLASKEDVVNGQRLAALIEEESVTMMQATPATWQMMIDVGWNGRSALKMLCGGEPLPIHLAQKLRQLGGELWNMYGPTETTIWSSIAKIESDSITIGQPIANTQVYVLDEQLNPLPIGVVGELYIGGDGMALGYHNRPELTAEKFINSPFDSGKLYRTGDIASFNSDGSLNCYGRVDHQVKIRGFRIETGEIEAHLNAHPDVQQCVVHVQDDRSGQRALVAYLVLNPSAQTDSLHERYRTFLQKALPAYMMPSAFVPLQRLPLTPNNKVDRKALPNPFETAVVIPSTSNRDLTEVEEAVSRVWRAFLKVEQVQPTDDFFELGGQSLIAAQIIFKLSDIFDLDLHMAALFEYPTVAELASHIEQIQIESNTSTREPSMG